MGGAAERADHRILLSVTIFWGLELKPESPYKRDGTRPELGGTWLVITARMTQPISLEKLPVVSDPPPD
jgi:hypothetical protein